jgi:outer membrane protein OmpA-like peptidoglycan-associated protein
MRLRTVAILAALAATPALAEKSLVNLHLQPGAGFGLDKNAFVLGVALKVDTTVIKPICGNTVCLSPQLELFGVGALNRQYLSDGQMFGGGLGLRLRFFNDERGYLLYPGSKGKSGNAWGNLWLDGHVTLADSRFGVGFDTAVGAEFSLIEGLSVGPFAKLHWTSPNQLLLFGLSFTIGAPQTTPELADYDNDGIAGDADKCADEPEDKDGFEDSDGCPDKDNDKDGVLDGDDKCADKAEDKDNFEDADGCPDLDNDADGIEDKADKCPNQAGVKEMQGCPDGDKDSDGIVDRLDKCADVKGIKENEGCPDTDKDADTVVDRLDKCPEQKGEVDNEGCPLADGDGDGVADKVDNCPAEAGPASNQGCPEAKKQLVVITKEKLVIKDKVFFDTAKSSIQKKSFPLLDQVAAILVGHTEIKVVQVEGHTDNVGKAEKNKKLSQDRAEAVKLYLSKKGVAETRLRAQGFGQERPADTNDTPAGRDNNRRVEFNIVSE